MRFRTPGFSIEELRAYRVERLKKLGLIRLRTVWRSGANLSCGNWHSVALNWPVDLTTSVCKGSQLSSRIILVGSL